MNNHKIIPFYQAFAMPSYQIPGYVPFLMAQEDTSEQDLQYLQEIFPETSRRYARKISDVVDRLDYKGSMIYDEFPDKLRLQRLSSDILRMIEEEEAGSQSGAGNGTGAMQRGGQEPMGPGMEAGMNMSPDLERKCREELIYVLLCYEIYKRRHGSNHMDVSRFYRT